MRRKKKHGTENGKQLKTTRKGKNTQQKKTQKKKLDKPAMWPSKLTGKTRNHADGESLITVKESAFQNGLNT